MRGMAATQLAGSGTHDACA